jgi:predicted class III extradiol MEMO1 family dioxygenase
MSPIQRTCSSFQAISVIGISLSLGKVNPRGTRFQYTYYDKQNRRLTYSTPQSTYASPPIYKAIETLDHEGMKEIESGNYESFSTYLSQTGNTICGR